MKKIIKFCLLLGICLGISGCSIEGDDLEDINIYTTTYPINFLINFLYGDHAKVYSIYPTGVNLDEYELSDRKLEEYSKSDLFVFNSLDKDRDYAVSMINKNEKLKVIDVATGISYNNSIVELWLNPYNYLMMAENIKNGLSEYISNPYLVSEIEEKYETLEYNISKLDADLTESINNANYKTIVVDDDMFKFLEKYGVTVISLENNDNLSANTISEVKKLINDKQIKYIYTINNDISDTINNLVKETKVEVVSINTMHSIDGGITNSNDDYFSVMSNNINLIKKELYK